MINYNYCNKQKNGLSCTQKHAFCIYVSVHNDNKWKRCHKLFHLTNYENGVLSGQYINMNLMYK